MRRGEKLSELVALQIVRDIAHRRLDPGTRLPSENAMLATYEVGRASLREALRILEVNGLITIRPGPKGGPFVAGPKSRDFGHMATFYLHLQRATYRELVEARLVMEPVMAALAARRQDLELLEQLESVIQRTNEASLVDDNAYFAVTTDFHSAVAGVSGNRILDLFGRALRDLYTERLSGMVFPMAEREKIGREHEAVATAILGGDTEMAERLMREHMEEFVDHVMQRYPGVLDEIVDWR
jgi:DNA-binding FadR family transcriptional regulator